MSDPLGGGPATGGETETPPVAGPDGPPHSATGTDPPAPGRSEGEGEGGAGGGAPPPPSPFGAGAEREGAQDSGGGSTVLEGDCLDGSPPVAGGPLHEVDPIAEAQADRDEYLDALRRLQADFENYRKRMAKQQGELTERAAEALVAKLLPVLDTLDLALAHVAGAGVVEGPPDQAHGGPGGTSGAGASEAGALAQVAGALADTLGKEGLERIDPQGQAFDPNEHDAVVHDPEGAGAGPEVSEVLRAGYRWKGRVLRPAMVKVKG